MATIADRDRSRTARVLTACTHRDSADSSLLWTASSQGSRLTPRAPLDLERLISDAAGATYEPGRRAHDIAIEINFAITFRARLVSRSEARASAVPAIRREQDGAIH
jgi:hypothetical protein